MELANGGCGGVIIDPGDATLQDLTVIPRVIRFNYGPNFTKGGVPNTRWIDLFPPSAILEAVAEAKSLKAFPSCIDMVYDPAVPFVSAGGYDKPSEPWTMIIGFAGGNGGACYGNKVVVNLVLNAWPAGIIAHEWLHAWEFQMDRYINHIDSAKPDFTAWANEFCPDRIWNDTYTWETDGYPGGLGFHWAYLRSGVASVCGDTVVPESELCKTYGDAGYCEYGEYKCKDMTPFPRPFGSPVDCRYTRCRGGAWVPTTVPCIGRDAGECYYCHKDDTTCIEGYQHTCTGLYWDPTGQSCPGEPQYGFGKCNGTQWMDYVNGQLVPTDKCLTRCGCFPPQVTLASETVQASPVLPLLGIGLLAAAGIYLLMRK